MTPSPDELTLAARSSVAPASRSIVPLLVNRPAEPTVTVPVETRSDPWFVNVPEGLVCGSGGAPPAARGVNPLGPGGAPGGGLGAGPPAAGRPPPPAVPGGAAGVGPAAQQVGPRLKRHRPADGVRSKRVIEARA